MTGEQKDLGSVIESLDKQKVVKALKEEGKTFLMI